MTNKKVIIDKRMRKIEKKRIQDMGYEMHTPRQSAAMQRELHLQYDWRLPV